MAMELDVRPRTLFVMATLPAPEAVNGIRGLLARVAGGTETKWRRPVGLVEKLPTWRYVRFNWRTSPQGTAEQPYVAG